MAPSGRVRVYLKGGEREGGGGGGKGRSLDERAAIIKSANDGPRQVDETSTQFSRTATLDEANVLGAAIWKRAGERSNNNNNINNNRMKHEI